MSGGWNAKHDARRTARRLWDAKMPRKRIAHLCGVSEETVSHWRWEDQWPPRNQYADRPIVAAKVYRTPRARDNQRRQAQLNRAKAPKSFGCPHCGTRSSDVLGHTACRSRISVRAAA